jgi:signal peptidase II
MSFPRRVAAYGKFHVLAASIIVADQVTKLAIQREPSLPLESYWPSGGIEVIPGFFYLAHIANTGAAWGMFPGFKTGFVVIGFFALATIFIYRNQLNLKSTAMQISFGLLCGGIIGNLIDRVRLHYVVDFLDFHLPGYRWPAFNVADSCISIGVAIYIMISIIESRQRASPEE